MASQNSNPTTLKKHAISERIKLQFLRPSINAAIIISLLLIAVKLGIAIFSDKFAFVNGKIETRMSRDYHYDQSLNKKVHLQFMPSHSLPPKYSFKITSPNNGYSKEDVQIGNFFINLYDSTGSLIERVVNDRKNVFYGDLAANKTIRLDFVTSNSKAANSAKKAVIYYKNEKIDSSSITSFKDFKTDVAPVINGSLWVKNRTTKWISKITPKFTILHNGRATIIHQSSSFGIIIPPNDSAIIKDVSIPLYDIANDISFDSINVQSIELQLLDRIVAESMRPESRYYEYR